MKEQTNQATHTPGPWTLEDDGWVYGPNGQTICDPHMDNRDIDERESTALLIAAAPELLAALQCAATILDGMPIKSPRLAEWRALIARATGGT